MIPFSFLICACLGQDLQPRFHIELRNGETKTTTIQDFSAKGELVLSDGTTVNNKQWFRLRQSDKVLPGFPTQTQSILINGDRYVGMILGSDGRTLRIRLGTQKNSDLLTIPLSRLAYVWFQPLKSQPNNQSIPEQRRKDFLYLRNGDTLQGSFQEMDERTRVVQFQSGQVMSLSSSKITGIAFNTELASVRGPVTSGWRVLLTNGTRCQLLSAQLRSGKLQGQTTFKQPVSFDLADVVCLEQLGEGLVFLNDLKRYNYRYTSFLKEEYPWTRNQTLFGTEFQVREKTGISTYDRGIGMHSQSELTFRLDGKYRRLDAQVALDAEWGKLGTVEIQVLLDGKPQLISKEPKLTIENGPWPIRLDLQKVKELTLAVKWSDGGFIGDVVNWINPVLIP